MITTLLSLAANPKQRADLRTHESPSQVAEPAAARWHGPQRAEPQPPRTLLSKSAASKSPQPVGRHGRHRWCVLSPLLFSCPARSLGKTHK